MFPLTIILIIIYIFSQKSICTYNIIVWRHIKRIEIYTHISLFLFFSSYFFIDTKKRIKKNEKKTKAKKKKLIENKIKAIIPFHYKFFLCVFLFHFHFFFVNQGKFICTRLPELFYICFSLSFALFGIIYFVIILMFCSHGLLLVLLWGWFTLSISLYCGGKEKHYEQLFDNIYELP